MEYKKRILVSPSDGTKIEWLALTPPEGVPRVGTLQLAHGMAEHKQRYIPFMEQLALRGYVCVISDHRGHGGSVASRDDLGFFGKDGGRAMVDDLYALTRAIKADSELYTEGQPFFLFGHSMGSLAVRAYAKHYDKEIDGLIVCGCPSENPATRAGRALARIIQALRGEKYNSQMMHNLVSGALGRKFLSEGVSAWLSKNVENHKTYNADPLCGFTFTVNGYISLFDVMIDCYSDWKTGKPDLPVLFISGADDPCMVTLEKLQAAAERMRRNGYKNVTIQTFEGMRHEILNETDCDSVHKYLFATLDEWRI